MKGRQQGFGFHFAQYLALLLQRAFYDHAAAFHVRFYVVRDRPWHLHEQALVVVVGR